MKVTCPFCGWVPSEYATRKHDALAAHLLLDHTELGFGSSLPNLCGLAFCPCGIHNTVAYESQFNYWRFVKHIRSVGPHRLREHLTEAAMKGVG